MGSQTGDTTKAIRNFDFGNANWTVLNLADNSNVEVTFSGGKCSGPSPMSYKIGDDANEGAPEAVYGDIDGDGLQYVTI